MYVSLINISHHHSCPTRIVSEWWFNAYCSAPWSWTLLCDILLQRTFYKKVKWALSIPFPWLITCQMSPFSDCSIHSQWTLLVRPQMSPGRHLLLFFFSFLFCLCISIQSHLGRCLIFFQQRSLCKQFWQFWRTQPLILCSVWWARHEDTFHS